MELQKKISEFEALGIQFLALSYDEPEALKDFADQYNITYPLLSDPSSKVIEQYGILNTLISADDHPWYGIPFPGTYVTDNNGVITTKFFESNLAVRVGPEQLLLAAQGISETDSTLSTNAHESKPKQTEQPTAPEIYLDGDHLALSVLRDLVVKFDVPNGRHLYAKPAPEGMVAVEVTLRDDTNLVSRDMIRPPSEPHTMQQTNETFEVHNGQTEFRLPLTVSGIVVEDSNIEEQRVAGTVKWQICDDEVCDIPQSLDFELKLPVSKVVLPNIGQTSKDPDAPKSRDTLHFEKLISRHKGD